MKKVLFIAGIIILALGVIPLMQYALDYNDLSNYGKGYIWGKIFIILLGTFLIFMSRRLKK
jgi:multisubunit Na+/H+ antiporter MnhG subunit